MTGQVKLGLAVALSLLAAVVVPGADARPAATMTLNVQFTATGSISVSLPDGTSVGTTAGTPTQIPAGYYTVWIYGPGGCAALPHFMLNGPGESIFDNLNEGETDNVSYNAYLLPNSTYTWKSDAAPSIVHTFTTGPTVQGSPQTTGPLQSKNHTVGKSTSLIGSQVAFRGNLAAAVTAAGKLSLSFKGKAATALAPGRYKVTVQDRSAKSGFALVKAKKALTLTTARFTGKHTATVTLTRGKWTVGKALLTVR